MRVCQSQAMEAGKLFIDALGNGLKIDIIVVSPLRRAIDTASLIAASIWGKVPILCIDGARETIGKHQAGNRSTRTKLQALYPEIDFQFLLDDEDRWAKALGNRQETWEERAQRAQVTFYFTLIIVTTMTPMLE